MNGLFRFSARIVAAACTLLLIGSSALRGQTAPASSDSRTASTAASAQAMVGSSGLEFLENKGQVVDDQGRKVESVRFTAHSNGAKLFFMPDRIAHVFIEASGPGAKYEPGKGISSKELDQTRIRYQRVDMELVGASQNVNLRGEGVLPGVTNFFTAAAGPDGITGVRSFSTIVYENVYPNIDLVLKARGKGMKAEFIVRPGGDPSQIRLRVSNADGVELTSEGGYRIRTALGVITEDAPYSFIRTANGEQEVAVRFRLDGDVIAFDVPTYDRSQTLVIDPGRDWSTFHGGDDDDVGTGIAVQRSFNPASTTSYIYICGYTAGGTFPIVSASQGTFGGGAYDAFVAAYQYGGTRAYSTYFGGSNDDRAWGITADGSGQVWVVGQSRSAAWGSGFFTNGNAGDVDAFVARFDAGGTPQAARFVGGTNDDYFLAVAYDGTNLTCGGYTASPGLATAGVFQTTYNGLYCGMIARLPATTLNAITWLTYYGNNTGTPNGQETYVTSLSPRGTGGEVWVGGYTNSPNTANAIATTGSFNTVVNNNGSGTTTGAVNFDGFVALMTSSGGRTAATYYGAVLNDRVLGVAADPLDATAVIAVGRTNSINAGNLIASATGFNTVLNNGTNSTAFDDGFVTRLTVSGTTLGRDWGSYWGSTADDYLTSVAVDDNNVNEAGSNTISDGRGGKIFVAGQTAGSSSDFATYYFDASFNSNQGGYDAVWSRILRAPGGSPTVEYSVITGGTGNDIATGIAVDNQRNVHLVGSATAGGGNLAAGGAQTTYGGGASDAFAIKWCNLIVPNAPQFSTAGESGAFSNTVSVCETLNQTATGFVTSAGAYPNVAAGTTSGSCPLSEVQTLTVRLTNAVQGVQYRLENTTSSNFLNLTPGTGTSAVTANTVVATQDGTVYVSIAASALPTSGTYDLRWVAYTQTVGSSCQENGITQSGALTVNALPANDAISQSSPGTDNNAAAAPGSTFNFYVCGGSINNFTVATGGLTYDWCVLQNGTITTAPNVANATNQTVTITLNTTAAQRDTLYLRVRLTNTNGCAIEYQAALYVLPVVDIQNGLANEATDLNANPQDLCVNSSGTVIAPATYSYQDSGPHTLVNTYGNATTPGNGATGSDPVTAVTQNYLWSATPAGPGITGVSLSNPSAANGGTLTITGSPTSNPETITLTLTEFYTSGGISGCNRQATYIVNAYPQPTVTVTPSPAGPVCEGTSVTFTINVTPSSVTSGSFSFTLNTTSLTDISVTPGAGVATLSGSGATYSGTFNAATFSVVVNPGTVTAAYDALGSISLTVNSLTSGPSSLSCGISSPVTSAPVTITQLPDLVNVATGSYNPGGNPTIPTLAVASPPAPATLIPVNNIPSANTITSTTACTWDNTNGYAQEYRYAIQEISTSQVPNDDDTYEWVFTLPAGLSVTVVSDANGNGIGTTFTGSGTFSLGPTANNPPNPERRGLRLAWNNTTAIPLTATITVIQTNNQSPGTCQRTMGGLNVTVRPLPAAFATSQYTWQGASAGSSHNVCENTNISITISGLANGTQVQLYQINQGANSGGAGFAYSNSTTLPSAIQTAGGAGTVSFTINSGSVTAGANNLPAWQDITVQFVAVDQNNCGRITGLVSPTLRVWDTPAAPIVSGPASVCPNKLTDPNAIINAAGIPIPGVHTYNVTNLASYPSGTTFQWQLLDNANNVLTPGVDYDITLVSTGGYNNNQAQVRFGKNLDAVSNLTWQVSVTFPSSSGGCTLPFTNAMTSLTVDAETHPDVAGQTVDLNAVASLSLPGLCSGQQATYAAVPGMSTYTWVIDEDGANNNSPTWASGGNPSPTIVGTFSINTVTIDWPAFSDQPLRWPRIEAWVQNANGCVEGDTVTVYILPVPQAGPIEMVQDPSTPWPDSACVFNGENSHIRAFTVPKSTNYTIANVTWNFTNGLTSIYSYGTTGAPYTLPNANDTVRVKFNGSGWERLVVTVTLPNGCSDTASLDFMVYPPASPVISGPTSVCHGSTHTYTATPYVSNDTYIWEIIPSSGGTITPTTNQSVINVNWSGSPNTSYTIRLTEVSPLGCTARFIHGVTVNPNPTPSISGPTTICAGQNYVYTTQDNSPNNSYAWSFTGLNSANATFVSGQNTATATVTTANPGQFTLRVIETVVATSCTGSATYGPVTVISSPTPSISRTSPPGPLGQACVGQTITYETPPSGNSYQWSVTGGGSIVGASNNNSVQIQWSATGTQTITLVETQGSCSTTVTQQVNVVAQPSPSISGNMAPCSGTDFSYTYQTANNAGSTYSWSLGTTGVNAIGPTTNAAVTVYFSNSTLDQVSHSLSVTETNSANCSNSASLNVTVTSTPQPVITGTSTVCPGQSINYSLTGGSILPPSTTYNWSVTGGTITGANTANNVTIQWTTSGSQTITLVAANGSCSKTVTYNVTVQAAPQVFNVGTSTPTACSNVSNNVTITLSGSQTGVTYTINRSPGGSQGTIAGTGNPLSFTQTVSTAGTYQYTITASNGTCTSTMNGTATVVVSDPPTATVSGPTSVCSGSSATFAATPTSGVTYAWSVSGSGNSVQSTTANQATILFGMTSGTATVTVVVTNSSGCQGTATQNVTVNALPLNRPVAISPSAICAAGGVGTNVTSATVTVGSQAQPVQANTTYQLLLGSSVVATQTTGGSPPDAITFTVGGLSAGTYVYSVRAISSTTPACTTVMTQTASLTVNALPTPAVTGNTTPCVGQTVTYTTQNNTGSSYAWTWTPGADFTAAGPVNTYQLTGSWGASGSKSVTVTETNSAGCGQSNTLNVTVSSQIAATVSGPSDVCSGSSATYTATPTSGVTYAWSVSGSGNSVQSTTANQATILFGMTSGTATVTVVVTNSSGCQGTATQNVTVNALPLNRPVAISPSAICAAGGVGTNVTSATITVGSASQPVEANTTYQLLQGSSVVATQTTGASPGNTVTFTVGSLSAGTYVYSVRAISSTTPACTTTMTQTVTLTVNPLPTPAISGPTSPCQGASVTYVTQNNTGSTYAWTWTPVADFTPAGPTNTYQLNGTWTGTGSATVTVTEINSAGCGQTNTLNVNVQAAPAPTITASQSNPICGGQTVTFTATPAGASSYTWTVGSNGTLQSGQGTQSITVTWANTPSSYSSSVSVVVNVGGCTGSASYTVNVNPQAMPNISGPASICSGQSGTYSTPLTTGRTYSWSTTATPPGMTPFSQSGVNLNSVTINWVNTSSSPFVATVQVVESAGGVCTGTATYNVTVNPLPSTAITGPTSVCQGQTVTYSHSPALTGHSFAWTVTNAQSWSGQGTGAITVTWGNTNGTVALTVTNNSTGCTANATNSPLSVTVNPNPTPTISGNVNPCAGSTETYSTQSGMSSYSWSITPASAGTIVGPSNQSSVNVQWSNTQVTATLTVQVNNSGCTGQQSVTINVQPKPTPAISGVSQTCPGVDRTFTTPYTAGNSYSWTVSYAPGYIVTGGSTTSNTITVRFNSPGASSATATLQVTETSPYGCQGTATQTVTVQPAPQPVITGNTNVCGYLAQYDGMPINNTETYVVSDANGINYSTANIVWTLPAGGGTFTGASSGTGVTTVTVQWDEPTAAATVGRQIAAQVTLGAPTNCSGQATSNVQVNWNPKPSISGPRAWCDNSVYTANSTSASQSGLATYSVQVPVTPVLPSGSSRSYDWTITPSSAGTIVSGQGTPSVQVSWTSSLANTPVNAVLSVTETINYLNASATPTNKFCGITDTFNVVINPIPKPVITSPNNGITGPNGQGPCGRDAYTYQVAADANSSYQWVVSGGTIVGSSTSNVVNVQWNNVTSPTPGYVGVTQTFLTPATMCSTYVQQDLTIQVKPSPKVTGPTVLCQQTTNGTNVGNYTVQTVVAGNTYQWTAEPASLVISSSTSGAQNQNFQVTWGGTSSTPLTARVIVLETNPVSGCSERDTLTITLNPNPTPVITSTTGGLNSNGVCAGSTHIYATQFNAGNSYLWTVTGGTISGANTNNQVTVVWGSAGSGTISVREQVGAMFGSGCWTEVTANVTIQPLPNPVITGPATVCRYTQQSYEVQTPNVNNTYQWTITNGQIVGASTNPSVTVLWYDVPIGTIEVTETTPPSQGSCSNTASLNVTINPKPAPVISGPPAPPVCVNSTQTYSTPLNTGNTYLWTVTGGTIGGVATNNTVTVTWTTVGNGTISVTETNTLGCDTTVSRTIPVNALPSVTITPSGPTTICNGQSLTLLATPGFVSYSWNTGETTPNIVVTQSGTYVVTVVDQNGCSNNSNSITVTVQNVPAPQIQASGPTTFCQGGSVTLSITGTNIQGYAWSNGATTSSITVTTSGSYWCEVTYNNGCKARTEIITVTVVPKPSVSITANGPTTFCEGGSVVLDAGAGFATYAWSNGSQTVGTNRTLTVTQAGNYTVTVTNDIGCSATSQPVTVTVYPKPAPQIQASGPTEFCEGGSVTLDAGAGFASYQWSNGATTRTITVTQQGTYTVTVTDQNNCSGTSQPVVVTVYPKPAKPTITQTGGTLTSSSAAQYQWYYNGEPISGATDRSYTLVRGRDNSGYYKVRIRDNNGCENTSDSIYIDITPVEVAGDNTGIQFMPNPTSGELRIVFGDAINVESARVIVRNLGGREMLSLELGAISAGTAKTLDLANLPNGVYMVEVILPNGMRTIGRVTKVD